MIAWVDVETTGLDPRDNSLLEVGIVLTDDDLNEMFRKSVVLKPPPWPALFTKPEVREMHEKSGLFDECVEHGVERDYATFDLARWLASHTTEPPVMAGSTVGFDRAWLKAKMPVLEVLFHYRSIDVSGLKELNKRWRFSEPWDGDRNIHRALPDIEDSIRELIHYRSGLATLEHLRAERMSATARANREQARSSELEDRLGEAEAEAIRLHNLAREYQAALIQIRDFLGVPLERTPPRESTVYWIADAALKGEKTE